MSGATIPLQPNSLYLCITMLFSPGFHWSLLATNSQGIACRYHWSENANAIRGTHPIESSKWGIIDPVKEYTGGNRLNISFFKIDAYVGYRQVMQNGQIFTSWATHEMLANMLSNIFQGFPTVRENRVAGISCRTWVMAALQRLRHYGFINRTETQIQAWEAQVKNIGEQRERAGTGSSTIERIL